MKMILKKLVCSVLLSTTSFWGYGGVLCQRGDGRVAVESSLHSRCSHDEHNQSPVHTQPNVDITMQDTCNPCVDIPFHKDVEPVKNSNVMPCPAGRVYFIADCSHYFFYGLTGLRDHSSLSFFEPLESIILRN